MSKIFDMLTILSNPNRCSFLSPKDFRISGTSKYLLSLMHGMPNTYHEGLGLIGSPFSIGGVRSWPLSIRGKRQQAPKGVEKEAKNEQLQKYWWHVG
jgi:hypothetical protein